MTEKKAIKKEVKTTKKEEKLHNVFVVEYYIKDLNTGKTIETNMPKQKEILLIYKGDKIILEGLGGCVRKVEDKLKTLKVGEDFKEKLSAKDSYGLRTRDKVRIIPFSDFKEHNLQPMIGMQINADGMIGTIKTVTGGRIMVDFNSPFADHEVEVYYKLKSLPKGEEKQSAFVKALVPDHKLKDFKVMGDKVKINFKADVEDEDKQMSLGMLNATNKYYFEKPMSFE